MISCSQSLYPDGVAGPGVEEEAADAPPCVPPDPGELRLEAQKLVQTFEAERNREAQLGEVRTPWPLFPLSFLMCAFLCACLCVWNCTVWSCYVVL